MPAGVCWFVVPMRFCDWAGEVDGVYLLTRRLSRASAATALLLALFQSRKAIDETAANYLDSRSRYTTCTVRRYECSMEQSAC